ncbi:hypothetical protein BH09CHL1_BH09CHL1_36320 [soil metagenome]
MLQANLERAIDQANMVLAVNFADVVEQSRNDEIVRSGSWCGQRSRHTNQMRAVMHRQRQERRALLAGEPATSYFVFVRLGARTKRQKSLLEALNETQNRRSGRPAMCLNKNSC